MVPVLSGAERPVTAANHQSESHPHRSSVPHGFNQMHQLAVGLAFSHPESNERSHAAVGVRWSARVAIVFETLALIHLLLYRRWLLRVLLGIMEALSWLLMLPYIISFAFSNTQHYHRNALITLSCFSGVGVGCSIFLSTCYSLLAPFETISLNHLCLSFRWVKMVSRYSTEQIYALLCFAGVLLAAIASLLSERCSQNTSTDCCGACLDHGPLATFSY